MKILLVSTAQGIEGKSGGGEIACSRLHKTLLNNGYNSKLLVLEKRMESQEVFSFYKNRSILTTIQKIINKTIQYTLFRLVYKNNPPNHYLHSSPKSVYDITNHELYKWADIINLHWVSDFLDYSSFFSTHNNKPIIWTLHDMNPFTGGCHHSESCLGFKLTCKPCPQLSILNQNYNNKNWKIKSKSNFSNLTIVTPSKWLKGKSLQSSLFYNQKHIVIPHSVDTTIFKQYNKLESKSAFSIPPKKKILLFIANNVSIPLKGMSYLIEAINNIPEEVITLVIGKTTTRPKIKNAIFLGPIYDKHLLAKAYNASDVFIMTSLAETFSLVTLESLCCGLPVVAFNTGPLSELISHGKNGFLVPQKIQLFFLITS